MAAEPEELSLTAFKFNAKSHVFKCINLYLNVNGRLKVVAAYLKSCPKNKSSLLLSEVQLEFPLSPSWPPPQSVALF